ncbi:MAG: hypothetical protein ACEPOV_03060 [Hyphomicrobiales bacterium]
MKKILLILGLVSITSIFSVKTFAQTFNGGVWTGANFLEVPANNIRVLGTNPGSSLRFNAINPDGSSVTTTAYTDKGWWGFGTVNPTSPFHVATESRFSRDITWDNNVNFKLDYGEGNGDFTFDFSKADGKGYWGVYDPTHKIFFAVRNNGRVGIGTYDPESTLHVLGDSKFVGSSLFQGKTEINGDTKITGKTEINGDAHVGGTVFADRVSLNIGSFPDYVFESNYRLRPLSEVEQYIKANKHLPGVPAASVIEKDGMNVGEVNRLLMEKVEELTLYTIQQEKTINNLSKKANQVDELQKQINDLKLLIENSNK